ncbi:MAG: hypothetical protein PUP91_29275 [Rhizonema sp. PD37]|nr:hypothetical protein [Rhizonema sp. PD37]
MITDKKRILIVGGVAGGASCAAILRRLSETSEMSFTQTFAVMAKV